MFVGYTLNSSQNTATLMTKIFLSLLVALLGAHAAHAGVNVLPRELQPLQKEELAVLCMSHMLLEATWADKTLVGSTRVDTRLAFVILAWYWNQESGMLSVEDSRKWVSLAKSLTKEEGQSQRLFCFNAGHERFMLLPEIKRHEINVAAAAQVKLRFPGQ